MRTLILFRHAKAVRAHEADSDEARGLTGRGRREAAAAGAAMEDAGLKPSLALVSNALRTRETADDFAKVLGVATRLLQADDSLYLADGEHILSTIRAVGPRVGHLMVIGHNPGISAAAIALAPEVVSSDLPTCGALTMMVSCSAWSLVDRRCVRDAERDAPRKFFDFG